MLEKLIGLLAVWIMSVISTMGYGGIVLLMAIESACIPLPSEIIMPFAGYLVFKGEMVLWVVALMGALGCVLGSIPAYYVGKTGGRQLAEKYGRFVLISKKDLKMADDWFKNYGEIIIFIATFHLGRLSSGGEAIAIISTDNKIENSVIESIKKIPLVIQAKYIQFKDKENE